MTQLAEGTYPINATAERTFKAGGCFINCRETERVHIEVEFGVTIRCTKGADQNPVNNGISQVMWKISN